MRADGEPLCIDWGATIHSQYELGVSEGSDGSSQESWDSGAGAFSGYLRNH